MATSQKEWTPRILVERGDRERVVDVISVKQKRGGCLDGIFFVKTGRSADGYLTRS